MHSSTSSTLVRKNCKSIVPESSVLYKRRTKSTAYQSLSAAELLPLLSYAPIYLPILCQWAPIHLPSPHQCSYSLTATALIRIIYLLTLNWHSYLYSSCLKNKTLLQVHLFLSLVIEWTCYIITGCKVFITFFYLWTITALVRMLKTSIRRVEWVIEWIKCFPKIFALGVML